MRVRNRADQYPGRMFGGTPPVPGANMIGPVWNIGNGTPSLLRDAFVHATLEQREQIIAMTRYLSGDIRAAADLTPAGDDEYLIPTVVQSTMERNYAAFAPVMSVARL